MWRLRKFALPLLLVITGCAGQLDRPPAEPDWQTHSRQVMQLEAWILAGRVAVRSSEQAETANIQWQQQGAETRLKLSGPLGTHATLVESDGKTATISRGEERSSWDLESTETWTPLGSGLPLRALPLQALPYWLKGVPAPGMEVELLQLEPNRELLQQLEQDGWQITYQRYENFNGITLPTRITLEGDDSSARLLIREWKTSAWTTR